MHFEDAIDQIVQDIKKAAGPGIHDWIDGSGDHHEGLEHVDESERDSSLFHVTISISTDFMSDDEVDALHERMTAVADEHSIAVDLTESNPDHSVYMFSLHSKFLAQQPARV